MRGLRALAWLACVGACAGLTKPSPRAAKREAVNAQVSTARDVVSSGKLAELDAHKGGQSAGGHAIDALGDDDPAASIKGTLSHVDDSPKDTKLKAETAYTTGGGAGPVLETKVSQHKNQGADAEHAELSEAVAFDVKGLSGSTARNAAAEMVKSRLATQTTRPVFEQGHGRRLQDAACEGYLVEGAEHQRTRMGTYVASGTCDGKTLYECVDCSASNKQYLWYNTGWEQWYIGSGGCGETRAGVRSPEGTSDDPGFITGWREYDGESDEWVETSTIFVGCTNPNCDDVTPGTFTADDETIRTAVNLWFDDRCKAIKKYGHISTWETGAVTDMSYLFCAIPGGELLGCNMAAASFNDNIAAWDTSGVTDMSSMFIEASAFDQPIGGWRVDKVTSMYAMFNDASSFDQPIGDWRIDKVRDMQEMFSYAESFNQPLSDWRVDEVKDMSSMFFRASAFDQALGWCVPNVVDILSAFTGTKCEAVSCGVVQGACPDPEAAVGDYCKLSDPKYCSGSRASFVEAPSNPFADIIENRYAVPALADVNGDGKADLLVGKEDGTLDLYRLTESEFQQVVGDEDPFKSVAVDGRAAPALVDLDSDGLLDLVVGAADGKLMYYHNEGSMTFRRVTATEAPTRAPTPAPTHFPTATPTYVPTVTPAPTDGPVICPGFDAEDFCDCQADCTGSDFCTCPEAVECCAQMSYSYAPNDTYYSYSYDLDDDGVARRLMDQDSAGFDDPFVNIRVDAHAAPAFVDLDGDGLADLVIGKESSGALTHYKNVGSRATPKFEAVSKGPFDSVIVGSFSKPSFYDLDNDGDQDLLVGDDVGDVLLFLNVGSRYAPVFVDLKAGTTPTYAAPAFGMLNGVPSLVVSSAPGQLVVYGEKPKVEFVTTKNKPFDGIDGPFDVGDFSTPSFVDLDGDGLLDLVVGGSEALSYYRNVGTPSRPKFEKVDKESGPFAGIGNRVFSGLTNIPTFEDIDGDGDLDLVLGIGGTLPSSIGGKIFYYRNVGTPSQPNFEEVVENNPFDDISVGTLSTPTFADLDNDGDADLIVGEYDGFLNYYRNVGTPSQPSFEKVDKESPFNGIDAGTISAPIFADLDNDGDLDLVVGEGDGLLLYWQNVGTPSQPIFEKVDEGSPFDGIDVEQFGAPAFADLDGDGDPDLIVGSSDGQLTYFQNVGSCRKTSEAGACSGHGVCGVYQGDQAACECLFGFEGGQCDFCREGHNGLTCEICKQNTVSIGGAPLAGEKCVQCSPGRFSVAGAGICELCPAGRYRSADDAEATGCDPCKDDTWSNTGQACDLCRIGYYRDDEGCVNCGEDKVCETTDVTLDNFKCIAGTYRVGDECKNCKSGMVCDESGVTIENVRLEKNRWRTSAESAKIETCPLKKSCRSTADADANVSAVDEVGVARRLEADSEPATADAGEALCTKGHEGPICAVCKRHYYRLGQECIKCRRSTIAFTVVGILIGIVIFLAFFFMAMSYSNVVAKGVNKSFEKSQESEISPTRLSRQGSTYFARADTAVQTADRPDPTDTGSGLKGWLEGEAAEALRRNVTTFVKQLSGTYSIFVNMPWVFDIKFPNIYERVLERLGLVNVDMSFSLECVISRKVTFQDRLLAATIGPIAAILLVIGLGVLYLGLKRNEHEHRKDRKRTTIMVIAQLVLLILFLSYTSTSTTIFRAFRPCDVLDEKYHGSNEYMHDDYSVSCKSSRYVFIVTWAALMLLVYPIGIPLVSFCLMWRHQEKLNPKVDSEFIDRDIKFETVGESESAFRQACVEKKTELRSKAVKAQDRELVSFAQLFHFMYDNYEPRYWWFECFDYLRRLALTGLMVIILPGSALQGFIGVLIALGGLIAYLQWKPFKEDASDWLGVSTQLSTFFVFLSALMIQVDAVYHRKGFGVLLTVVTFIPPFISLCCALHAFHSTKRSLPKLGSSKDSTSKAPAPAKDDVADPESSPASPLARNAPAQEDEEAPAAPAKN